MIQRAEHTTQKQKRASLLNKLPNRLWGETFLFKLAAAVSYFLGKSALHLH